MQAINETDNQTEIAAWYIDAKAQTTTTLPEFIRHLTEDYKHDYGTIVSAFAAIGVAACSAADKTPQGGITGFQAGGVMWKFMRYYNGVETPARLVRYRDMLYPQYAQQFEKTIDADTWSELQAMAKSKLAAADGADMSGPVAEHMRAIVRGVVPFGYAVK